MRALLLTLALASACGTTGDGKSLPGPCDKQSCHFGEICITEVTGFCGGAPPPCVEPADGGACPADYAPGFCASSGQSGCVGQCITTGHHCMTTPAGCNPARCSCLPSSVCSVGTCSGVTDGIVECISA